MIIALHQLYENLSSRDWILSLPATSFVNWVFQLRPKRLVNDYTFGTCVCVQDVLCPDVGEIPDLDEPVLAHCQQALSVLVQVHVDDRMLGVIEWSQRGALDCLKLFVARITGTHIKLEAHYGYVNAIGGTVVAHGFAAVATMMLSYSWQSEITCKTKSNSSVSYLSHPAAFDPSLSGSSRRRAWSKADSCWYPPSQEPLSALHSFPKKPLLNLRHSLSVVACDSRTTGRKLCCYIIRSADYYLILWILFKIGDTYVPAARKWCHVCHQHPKLARTDRKLR